MKAPNEQRKGSLPVNASPAAVPIMLASAIPISKNRSGNFLAKISDLVDLARSASSTTISVCFSPRRARDSPKACLVALAMGFSSKRAQNLFFCLLRVLGGRSDAVPADLVFHE